MNDFIVQTNDEDTFENGSDEEKLELIVEKQVPKSLQNHQNNKPAYELNFEALKKVSTYERMIEDDE